MAAEASFEQAVVAQTDFLHGVAVRMTRNEDDAQDLVQETLLRALRFFDRFEPGTNCRAWLCRILKNAFINRHRQQRRKPYLVNFDCIEETWETRVQDWGPKLGDPEEILLNSILREDVRQAFARLSPPSRRALSLALVGGYSYREIADMMDCPVGTIMSRIHRARLSTRERLLHQVAGRPWAALRERNTSATAKEGEMASFGALGRPLGASPNFGRRTPVPSMMTAASNAAASVPIKAQSY